MKITFSGHSHINCISDVVRGRHGFGGVRVGIVQLRDRKFKSADDGQIQYDYVKAGAAIAKATEGAALAVLCPAGNQHFLVSMQNHAMDDAELLKRIRPLMQVSEHWIDWMTRQIKNVPAVVMPPPPPFEAETHLLNGTSRYADVLKRDGVPPASLRLRAWRQQQELTRKIATAAGIGYLDLPAEVMTDHGFLPEKFLGLGTHANTDYGAILLRHAIAYAKRTVAKGVGAEPVRAPAAAPTGTAAAGGHPYKGLPDIAFWKQAVADVPARQLDPVGAVPYTISRSDRVATAGSCFAQHISKRIREAGFQFLVTEEPGRGEAAAAERGFYDFSARFGNLYTARQLLQLFDRAFGYFTPVESHWALANGRWCDPFRPRIEPDGYASIEALEEDRKRHLAAVRRMFEQLDVMVFTLGLTECWVSRLDGAALPLVPGVSGGVYDPSRYAFVNFGVEEVAGDLDAFIRKLRLVNPKARMLLTVSPVPLVATYEPRHVLVSTTYSKSVLRVAADMARRSHENVCYFPSYEIITGHYNRGRYFGPDLRSVTEEGVDHVMAVFMRRMTDAGHALPGLDDANDDPETAELRALAEAECDEEVLGRNSGI